MPATLMTVVTSYECEDLAGFTGIMQSLLMRAFSQLRPMQTAVQFQVLEVFVLCALDRLVRSAHRAGGWWIAHVRNNRSIAQQSTDRACPVLCYRRLPWRCMLRLLLPLHSCDWLLFKHLDDKQRPFCQLMHACSYPLIR